jgi:hypothetical protein
MTNKKKSSQLSSKKIKQCIDERLRYHSNLEWDDAIAIGATKELQAFIDAASELEHWKTGENSNAHDADF